MARVVVLGTREELAAAFPLLDGLPANQVVDLMGRIDLPTVAACLSRCDLYVGNDSFGHHVMSQSGKPCFIIMLDTPRAYTDYSINQYNHI